ncbi:MAG: bifunctional glutamate N-acetyltransferase/amino-acid acetyltransferase ArgJ [Deltaproteobacteria bacterium]|jgi:glutamate N-acetyltransferase/amino-acid N-acetyltransferase|nr:bifunctional glutamate N-acetyltransferase/amino-acid acetyltransferase ArgJ [Deltaproteobacteria bacterium]
MLPEGFKAGAAASGARYADRLDLGLILAEKFYSGAAVFTRNLCRAAPVLWSGERFPRGRAILANAGQANAQTGERGLSDCRLCAEELGKLLHLPPDEILLASTGVIGQNLNTGAILKALPELVRNASPAGFPDFASAILTTDTRPKIKTLRVEAGDSSFRLAGCAKGAGMLSPSMATMLAFVLTDLKVEENFLLSVLRHETERTFNRVTVDGDTSTNDSLFLISSGAAGAAPLDSPASSLGQAFKEALREILDDLAQELVRDGEGATRLVTVEVKGARNDQEAAKAARTVCESPLVKTAFFGSDPNWGRILAALGRSGAAFDPYKVDLFLDSVPWVKNGVDNQREKEAQTVMRKKEYALTIDLRNGPGRDKIYTSDLSHGYVTINASYRS